MEFAKTFLGKPYRYGAYLDSFSENQDAFDCSSFVQHVFKKNGIDLPRSTILQAAFPGEEIYTQGPQPADVLFFEGTRGHYRHDLFPERKLLIGHVAIYVGCDKIIHAVNSCGFSGVIKQRIRPPEHPLHNINTIVLVKRFI